MRHSCDITCDILATQYATDVVLGTVMEGVVARTLRVTSSPTHPYGIKVMGIKMLHGDGRVGRVKAIVTTDAC